METIYIFKLPAPINGQTHVRVTQEIRDGRRTNIVGEYGKLLTGGEWAPAELMHAYGLDITNEDRVDLISQANSAGRPSALADHDVRSDDVASWLAEDPTVRQARIEARNPKEDS